MIVGGDCECPLCLDLTDDAFRSSIAISSLGVGNSGAPAKRSPLESGVEARTSDIGFESLFSDQVPSYCSGVWLGYGLLGGFPPLAGKVPESQRSRRGRGAARKHRERQPPIMLGVRLSSETPRCKAYEGNAQG